LAQEFRSFIAKYPENPRVRDARKHLHEMGLDLADICFGLATPSEFRTEPLMGLGLRTRFLHDGRASTIEDAVRLHAGEATGSRDRFGSLSGEERRALLKFLASL